MAVPNLNSDEPEAAPQRIMGAMKYSLPITPLLQSVLLLSVLLLGACSSTTKQPLELSPQNMPDISGSWELDYELSENANDKLQYLYEVTRSHYQQRQAMRQDQSPARAFAAMADLQGVIDLGRLTDLITRTSVLTIDQTAADIVVERENDFALICDFLKTEVTGNDLGKEICGWHEGQLIFHVQLPDGLTVNHRLVLSQNGERLNVATTVSSNRISQPFTLNRVYMPFEPGEGMFDCEYTLARKKTCRLGTSE